MVSLTCLKSSRSTSISMTLSLGRLTARPLEVGCDLLGEVGAVGEAGQRVVVRHEVDALLGLDARGDVFEQRDRAALHRADRDFAVLVVGEVQDDLAAAVERDDLEQAVGGALRDGAARRGARDQRGEGPAGPVAGGETGEDLLGAIVDDGDPAVLVEHAEAVLHGVERGIELDGEAAGLDPAVHRR